MKKRLGISIIALLMSGSSLFAATEQYLTVKPAITQSGGYTYLGATALVAGFIGLSYDRALVKSKYNLGSLGLVFALHPARSWLTLSLGFTGPLDNRAVRIYESDVTSGIESFNILRWVRVFGSIGFQKSVIRQERFTAGINLDLRYFINSNYAYCPIGFAPALGISLNLGKWSDD
jgi:hypothetical protein